MLRRFRPDPPALDCVPSAGATLADFAVHPNGDVSILLVTDDGYALERWAADGSRGGAVAVAGVVPTAWSRDAGRIAPLGNDVVLTVRTDTNAVRAYRYQPDAAGYRQVWDVLVEPVNDLVPTSITSGSFDTFGQLKNPFRAYLDVGPDGAIWIGVPSAHAARRRRERLGRRHVRRARHPFRRRRSVSHPGRAFRRLAGLALIGPAG